MTDAPATETATTDAPATETATTDAPATDAATIDRAVADAPELVIQGLAGAFLMATDAAALARWYRDKLGIVTEHYGKAWFVEWPSADRHPGGQRLATVTLAIFQADEPVSASKTARLGYRVVDLDQAIAVLTARGVEVTRKEQADDYGRFAWVHDPEGNRVELWEPPPLGTPPPPIDG